MSDDLTYRAAAELIGGVTHSTLHKFVEDGRVPYERTLNRIVAWLGDDTKATADVTAVTPTVDQDERRALDAARRLCDTLTMAWARGQFSSLDHLAQTAREITGGMLPVGRGYVERWIEHFNVDSDVHSEGRPAAAGSSRNSR